MNLNKLKPNNIALGAGTAEPGGGVGCEVGGSIRAKVFLMFNVLMLILRAKIALNAVICMILFIFSLIMES